MSNLFRTEAVVYQQQKLLGTIILRQGWPTRWLTLGFGVLVGALIVVFFLFGFARRETLSGLLLPAGTATQAQKGECWSIWRRVAMPPTPNPYAWSACSCVTPPLMQPYQLA